MDQLTDPPINRHYNPMNHTANVATSKEQQHKTGDYIRQYSNLISWAECISNAWTDYKSLPTMVAWQPLNNTK